MSNPAPHPLDGLLEPGARDYDATVSIAISLKRIADGTLKQHLAQVRQATIDYYVDSCENCGSYEFPKHSKCDGCTAAADEMLAGILKQLGECP